MLLKFRENDTGSIIFGAVNFGFVMYLYHLNGPEKTVPRYRNFVFDFFWNSGAKPIL